MIIAIHLNYESLFVVLCYDTYGSDDIVSIKCELFNLIIMNGLTLKNLNIKQIKCLIILIVECVMILFKI